MQQELFDTIYKPRIETLDLCLLNTARYVLKDYGNINIEKTLECYSKYMDFVVEKALTYKQFVQNMELKLQGPEFLDDTDILLRASAESLTHKEPMLWRRRLLLTNCQGKEEQNKATRQQARKQAYASINTLMIQPNWLVGRRIVEEEQGGAAQNRSKKGSKFATALGLPYLCPRNMKQFLRMTFQK